MRGPNQVGPMLLPVGKNVKKKVDITCACLKSRENGSGALNRMLCARLKRGPTKRQQAIANAKTRRVEPSGGWPRRVARTLANENLGLGAPLLAVFRKGRVLGLPEYPRHFRRN